MQGRNKPNIVDTYLVKGVITRDINFNFEEAGQVWTWDAITLSNGVWDYSSIVDALITYKYPNDKMQSVINNYLLEPDNAEYVAEFNKMQAWRKEAKGIAKQALEYEVS